MYVRVGRVPPLLAIASLVGCGGLSEESEPAPLPDLGASARLVVDLNTQPPTPDHETNSSFPSFLTSAGSIAYFVAFPNWGDATGPMQSNLYRTDGTEAGTAAVHAFGENYPHNLSNADFGLAFTAKNPADNAPSLWVSDGTESGTMAVRNFSPGNYASGGFVHDGGYFLYIYDDTSENSGSLWRTDGTQGAVQLFSGGTLKLGYLSTSQGLYFATSDGTGSLRLTRTDGTPAGTVDVATIPTDADGMFCGLGDGLLAATHGADAFQLWSLSGGTIVKVGEWTTAISWLDCRSVGKRAVINIGDDSGGVTLWSSDGTEAGTIQLSSNALTAIATLGHSLLIATSDGLFTSDGTNTRTALAKGAFSGFGTEIASKRLVYERGSQTLPGNLWITDGTASGTHVIWRRPRVDTNAFTEAGDNVVFVGHTQETGYELWSAPRSAFQ